MNASDMLPRSLLLLSISARSQRSQLQPDFLSSRPQLLTSITARYIHSYNQYHQTIGPPTLPSCGVPALASLWGWKPSFGPALNRSEAAAKIATQYSSIANLAGVKAKDSKLQTTVFGWRSELRAGRVKNFEASELFAEGIKRIDQLASPEAYRKFAIRQFAEAANFSCVFSPSA
jgi:hypothetical protein